MYALSDYSYDLPRHLIAQIPSEKRDMSRLLKLDSENGLVSHHIFHDIEELLLPSDILVVNNTRVFPGRLYGKKDTGGKVEILILDYEKEDVTNKGQFQNQWTGRCLVKTSKRAKPKTIFRFEKGLSAEVVDFCDGVYTLRFSSETDLETLIWQIGHMPLPPYIKRDGNKEISETDKTVYQTVYASNTGAVAAPTAGLHFTQALLEKLGNKGITIVEITLHVGYGTFLPVRVNDIREHRMHSEKYHISKLAAETINRAKSENRRVLAVGTTSVRTLEHGWKINGGRLKAGSHDCDLFIYPGFDFCVIDGIVTNFHLPESTLLMLVSAFAGRGKILDAYKEAVENEYRFFSYGDAMLIV